MVIFYLLAITIGFLVAFQSGLNAGLSKAINSNIWAAVISFFVGLMVLLLYVLATQQPLPVKKLTAVPPYLFIGGSLGAMFVLSIIILFPKIGAVNVVIFTVAGQMLCSNKLAEKCCYLIDVNCCFLVSEKSYSGGVDGILARIFTDY